MENIFLKTKKLKLFFILTILLNQSIYAIEDLHRDRIPSIKRAITTITQDKQKEVSIVDNFRHIFEDAKTTVNIRSMHSSYDYKNDINTYATAVGANLKYELAQYNGFNGALGFITTYDIDFASGDKSQGQRNNGLSSTSSKYTEVNEAYINYKFKNLNFRIGSQKIDTPLADSDDNRMVPNTFEAYIATFELSSFSFMVGHLGKWQGSDAGLDNGWIKSSKDGSNFIGLLFKNDFINANAWYYNINGETDDKTANNAIYLDAIVHYDFNDNLTIDVGMQYLNEKEQDNSGIKANIYGAMAEFVVHSLGINIAYNKSIKQDSKTSFSGFGGGALFTNMDNMIIDNITTDRDAYAIVSGLSYSITNFNLLYAYGDFNGKADSNGEQKHIIEQDIGVEYSPNDALTLGTIMVIDKNKKDLTSKNFNNTNFRAVISYNY